MKKTQNTIVKGKPAKKRGVKKVSLKKQTAETFDKVKDMFNENGGFHTMLFFDFEWFLSDPSLVGGEKSGYALMLDTEEAVNARRELVHTLGGAAAMLELLGVVGKPRAIRMASEAWTSKNIKQRPSEDPDRVETLMVSVSEIGGDSALQTMEIVRDGDSVNLKESKEPMTIWKNTKKSTNDDLLSLYWESYREMQKTLIEADDYKQFNKFVLEDPVGVFTMVMQAALVKAESSAELNT